jgi:hypothetical protein
MKPYSVAYECQFRKVRAQLCSNVNVYVTEIVNCAATSQFRRASPASMAAAALSTSSKDVGSYPDV